LERLAFNSGRSHIGGMIRLQISVDAFAAIADTLLSNVGFENKRALNGDYFVWLDPTTVAKLRQMRGPGESFSDVILRLADRGPLRAKHKQPGAMRRERG
jgi:hypothetical protein